MFKVWKVIFEKGEREADVKVIIYLHFKWRDFLKDRKNKIP